MKNLLYIIVLACTAVACSKSEQPAGGGYPADGVVRISPTVAAPLTRAEGSAEFSGSRLRLGLYYGDNDKYSKTALWKKDADGNWNSSSQLLWKNATDEVVVYAYVPDDSSVDYNHGLIAPSEGIPSDQSAGLEDADWLWYSEKVKPGEALVGGKLNVELNHALLKLTVNLSFGDEFGGTPPEIKEVWLNGTMKKVYVSYKYDSRGQLSIPTASQSLMDIKMHKAGEKCYEAIFYPSTGQKAGGDMLTVILANGRDYHLKLSEDLALEKDSRNEDYYLGGCAYSMSAKIGKDKVQLGTIKVAPWDEKSSFGGFYTDATEYSEWDGKEVSSGYTFSGTGSEADQYIIKSAEDLAGLAANVNAGTDYKGKYFLLNTNIDLMGYDWTPIGANYKFAGTFDGNNKTILNLNVPKGQYAGLFGYCSVSAEINNLKIRNASVKSNVIGAGTIGGAGIVAGYCHISFISNCTVEGTVVGDCYVGGIVGFIYAGEISDCTAEVSCIGKEGSSSVCGGIAGLSETTTIKDCTVRGEVKGTYNAGGFVGNMDCGEITVTNRNPSYCYADVSLYEVYKPSSGTETYNVGGLVGVCGGNSSINMVYASGKVSLPSGLDIYGGVVNLGGYIGYVKNTRISVGNFLGSIEAGTPANGTRNAGAFIGWLDAGVKTDGVCKYYRSKVGNLPVYGANADGEDGSGLKITTFD